jgi:hypothetical protein
MSERSLESYDDGVEDTGTLQEKERDCEQRVMSSGDRERDGT